MDYLKKEAISLYFGQVKVFKYRRKFVENIKSNITIKDQRNKGYYCTYCADFSSESISFVKEPYVIYKLSKNPLEIWIVNNHYCGCRGWS